MTEETVINVAQIALPLTFDRQYSFENFFTHQADFVVTSLKSLITAEGEQLIGLWGGRDSGKTHLLNACAFFARSHFPGFQLYDATQLVYCEASQFDDLASDAVLAIDNLDAVCGNRHWEAALYRLINRCRDQHVRLIFSLSRKPQDLNCELPDFQSRLSWGLLLELPVADEAEIEKIVYQRGRLLGIDLSSDVRAYLLTHYPRRLSLQLEILRKLDKASLSSKKKITIPLIKQVLN